MDEEEIITAAKNYIGKLFAEDFSGHDAAHSLRVYRNALRIADTEPGCCRLFAALAALLHDADDHKLFRTENNANARAFMMQQQMDAEAIEEICEMINSVSFSKNRGRTPGTLEAKIVQDADRLDAIGAIGIARTFAYGGAHGRPIADSVQHFDDKLLLLKDEMNTQEGRRIARLRHEFLENFSEEIRLELESKR